MRTYDMIAFIRAVSSKTRTATMAIATDGTCASSTRYLDVAVPSPARVMLGDGDLAFLTFDDEAEAVGQFEAIVAGFPASGETTLGIHVALALSSGRNLEFRQEQGMPRELSRAA